MLPQYLILDTNYIPQAAKGIISSRTFYQYFFQKQYIHHVSSKTTAYTANFRSHLYVLKKNRGKVVFLHV